MRYWKGLNKLNKWMLSVNLAVIIIALLGIGIFANTKVMEAKQESIVVLSGEMKANDIGLSVSKVRVDNLKNTVRLPVSIINETEKTLNFHISITEPKTPITEGYQLYTNTSAYLIVPITETIEVNANSESEIELLIAKRHPAKEGQPNKDTTSYEAWINFKPESNSFIQEELALRILINAK